MIGFGGSPHWPTVTGELQLGVLVWSSENFGTCLDLINFAAKLRDPLD